jgi:hypothetical protein
MKITELSTGDMAPRKHQVKSGISVVRGLEVQAGVGPQSSGQRSLPRIEEHVLNSLSFGKLGQSFFTK